MEQPRHFLQIEISEEKREVTLNGCPEALRMLANELHKLAAEAEARGKIQMENYSSPDWGGLDLEVRLLHPHCSSAKSFSVCAWPSSSYARQYLRGGA